MTQSNIPQMQSDFERIRRTEDGQEFWTSRELCPVLGYSTYQKFERLLTKAMEIAQQKGLQIDEHFNQTVEMAKLGSGAFRRVENIRLSRMACMIIAENADGKKPQVQMAREYFAKQMPTTELVANSLENNILFYKTNGGETRIQVIFNSETFWMSQRRMAELFGVEVPTINYHLSEIYKSGELRQEATIRKILIVQDEGEREVNRQPLFYNLDAIIAVGYRVNSYQATQFRIWATTVLKEFIIKGFVLDDERLKQNQQFGRDYFDDLLERIREIRTSERRYYQKITDIFAETSIDYDKKAETTRLFFARIQNIMHWAVTKQTAAEIIYNRADAAQPHMGLTTWKNAPDGRVQKSDSIVAKNYLSENELDSLNRLSNLFLEMAESRARRHLLTKMADWEVFLESFMQFNDYELLQNNGTISAEQAQEKAFSEYEKFRLIQDRDYLSDFDREIERLMGN